MAPMTRTRTLNDVADELVALYYSQRASAGLIITEGLPVSEEGRGYLYTPGLYNEAQMHGWRKVTDAVHAKGGRILLNFGMWDECHMFQCYLKIKHQYHLELFQQLTLQYLRILILENLVRLHQAFLER